MRSLRRPVNPLGESTDRIFERPRFLEPDLVN